MPSGTWAFSCPYLALVDGPVLSGAREDAHGKEMAELVLGLEGHRETSVLGLAQPHLSDLPTPGLQLRVLFDDIVPVVEELDNPLHVPSSDLPELQSIVGIVSPWGSQQAAVSQIVRGTEGAVGQLSHRPAEQVHVAPSTGAHCLGQERCEALRKKPAQYLRGSDVGASP